MKLLTKNHRPVAASIFILLLVGSLLLAGCDLPGQSTPPPTPVPPTPTTAPMAPVGAQAAAPAVTTAPGETPPPAAAAGAEAQLAAKVNGQPIYLADYEKQVAQFETAMVAQGADMNSEGSKQQLAQVRRQILEAMIDQMLIEQAAGEYGVTITDEEVEAKAQESIQQGQTQEQFQQWLTDNNMTYDEFKKTLRSQLLAARMFDQVTASTATTADQVHIRHILMDKEDVAQKVLAELQAGGDFAALAQQYSIDDSTRANGGDWGWFPQGLDLIPPELEAEAFRLQPGQMSNIIHSQFGYHIIKIEARETGRALSAEMLQAAKQKTFAQWLAKRRESASIERLVQI